MTFTTELFKQNLKPPTYPDVKTIWMRFASYLDDIKFADRIVSFQGMSEAELMNRIDTCVSKGPSELLDQACKDSDADFFQAFNKFEKTVAAAKKFLKEMGF